MSNILNAADFPLWGSRLIEASAGTGKTWTIAALYLRLVLGHGQGKDAGTALPSLRPAEILVMTFTRAATRELSDRIRARLLEAAKCFRGEAQAHPDDKLLKGLIADYEEGAQRTSAAWRLATAAESMDDASVHTIDAWCQRMLREHAFDSGCLFDEVLVADENAILLEAVQDYWRQQCYPLESEALDMVLGVWKGVDELAKDMRSLVGQPLPVGAGAGSLAQCMQEQSDSLNAELLKLSAGWVQRAQAMQIWLDEQTTPQPCDWDRRKLARGNYTKWLTTLGQWAADPCSEPLVMTAAANKRFRPEGILEARNPGTAGIQLPDFFQAFADLIDAYALLPKPSVAMRLHAATRVGERTDQLKRQMGGFGFADMLNRLDQALSGPNGDKLRSRILTQYPVAMIDEFQDTSPLQYNIFNQIYRTQDNDPTTALLLIGDPKQSIYGFRGADIYSYLQARRATEGRHYVLGTNHRSTTALVGAVNQWFSRGEDQRAEAAFMFKEGDVNPLPFVSVNARGRAERFQTGQGSVSAMTLAHDLEPRNKEGSRELFAGRCAEQIVCWLNDPQAGFEAADKSFKRIRPADMAVLVRTGTEAIAVRRELRLRGVASVYLSDKDSVFDSNEAGDLLHWLRAVASPLDVRLVRAALASRTVGLSLDELAWLAASDEAFDVRSEQMRSLHVIWQNQGVLTMLRQTLHLLGLPVRWLAEPEGERRMTNVLHLAELLQAASAQLDGEQAVIRWLESQMQEGASSSDEQIGRLESDADLVKVVTVHKSKGLEYPVVFLPFACSFREMEKSRTPFVKLADEAGERELFLQFDAEQLARADRDRLREDLRLLYVALTRARHTVWMGFAALTAGQSKECKTYLSAAGYLLGGPDPCEPETYLGLLQELAAADGNIALIETLQAAPRTALILRDTPVALQDVAPFTASFERNWTIGSFTSLVRALAAPVAALAPTQSIRPADDELPPVGEQQGLSKPRAKLEESAVWHRFIRGAVAGNFLHAQLEWLAGEGFALANNEVLADRLRRRSERAGRADQGDAVVSWLTEVVRTPLPGVAAALCDLDHVLPEMEFWLPAQRLKAPAVDSLCKQHLLHGIARASLPERELHGMLMGFADLVFEHQGRYWVLDYKSNFLGDDATAYHRDALEMAMAEHRYDVQAALYMLALHRLLRARLGESYQPEVQLGGAIYLFLRGIDGPEKGAYCVPPTLALLDALDAMLTTEEQAA